MKRDELQNDIIKVLQKVAPFSESGRLNIHLIYNDIYMKYLKLPKEEFKNESCYISFISFVAASKEINDIEITKLSRISLEKQPTETLSVRSIFTCVY